MLSLYIHIPFCVKKCPYCGFYSTLYTPENVHDFIHALGIEAATYQAQFNHRVFHSVYIGGGTPTVLSCAQAMTVGEIIKSSFHLARDIEWTVEANPNTVTGNNLAAWREAGVNRLSLGIQSFSDDVLRTLGRAHTAADAGTALHTARSAGFSNIGVDLIYGIPGQTMAHWEASLLAALAFEPEHLSIYSLSIDEGSLFHADGKAGKKVLPDGESVADMYEFASTVLAKAGYGRYEISNFALPGFECNHNINYWERGEYLGLGPGAHSFISGKRFYTVGDHRAYTRRMASHESAVAACETPNDEEALRESVLLGLRTKSGLDLRRCRDAYDARLVRRFEASLAPLTAAGLLQVREGRVAVTERGIMLLDLVLTRLSV